MDGLDYAGGGRLGEIANIDGEEDVGRAVASFRLDALDQALFGEDDIDLDAGLLREPIEQGVDQNRLAVGIDIHLGIGGACWHGGEGEKRGERETSRRKESHLFLQLPEFKAPVSD